MDNETQIYRDLQKHLNRMPDGFPAVESGLDIKILKRFFTPEEARVALELSMKPEPLERIYNRLKKTGMSIEELQQHLEQMIRTGTVIPNEEGYNEKRYSNASFGMGGVMTVQVERVTKDMFDEYSQYRSELSAAQPGLPESAPPLRTIPVEKSIPVPEKYKVNTYDDVRKIIDDLPGPIAVANCICRHTARLLGGKCTKTDLDETCIIIGPDHAKHYVDMGVGRFITKEETFDLLDKVQEAGLVLQPENSQRPEAICCCCGDCCVLLKPLNQHPRPVEMYITNFYAQVDRELCKGCPECAAKCQMNAITVVDNVAMVNLDRCIGCGGCVVRCPEGAIRMIKKEPEKVPVKDKDAYNMKLLSGKMGGWDMMKLRMKMLLGMKV